MTKTLTFATIEQAALWLELDGQISDGQWENAKPYDHYKVWCEAEVKVGDNVGRNFYARKDNYNLTSKELLDVVEKRMIGMVRIARAFGLQAAKEFEFQIDLDGQLEDSKAVAMLCERYDRGQVLAALANPSYGHRELMRDLREMKTILKTYKDERVSVECAVRLMGGN